MSNERPPREVKTYAPNRIKALRLRRGLSMEKLGQMMKRPASKSTIQKLEESSMGLTLDYLFGISEALGCSPVELMEMDALAVSPARDGPGEGAMVPILGTVPAGNWREAIHDPQGYVWVPSGVGGNECFALRPDGDSMNLIVPDGPSSYIVIDAAQRDMLNGKIYVVENGEGETTFKRYRASPAALMPVSSNPVHQPIMIGESPFKTIGRVVYAGVEL